MKYSLSNFKQDIFSINDLKKIIIFSILIILPWILFSEILKFLNLVFYNSFNFRFLISNILFSFIIIIFFRSLILSIILFYSFSLLPFITYYFLRRGILFNDFQDFDELMYALGDFQSLVIKLFIILFLFITLFLNIRFFKIKIFLFQIFISICIFFSYTNTFSFQKFFYPVKPNIEDFNVSAAFRNIGPIDAFFYHYLNTISFERKIRTYTVKKNYDDFRSYNLDSSNKKNIHIILMESFIDPTDFKNIEIGLNVIPKSWSELKNENIFYGISPVIGGGSAQSEFEILCGAPSFLEFGTEFNRIGDNHTNCLPNYLKKFGYITIASQPMFGSFFNIEKAYNSLGFEKSYLTPSFDMSDMNNGWLSDKSLFSQHFEFIKNSLTNDEPILNYIFAVGCHNTLGQKNNYGTNLIHYPKSKKLEDSLNCNAKSIQSLTKYIDKIKKIDPESLIIILPDHYPPGINEYKEAGHICRTSNEETCDKIRKMRIIITGTKIRADLINKNFAYYELPELIINQISNNNLCQKIVCSINGSNINLNGNIVNRNNLEEVTDQSLSLYHKELYLSLLRESL